MRRLVRGLVVLVFVTLALPASAGSVCGRFSGIVAAVANDVAVRCDCCRVSRDGPRRRCVRHVAKAAVHEHRLPRALAGCVVHELGSPCPLAATVACAPATTTTLPGCSSDPECDDGNPCTQDACQQGRCAHVCECFSATDGVSCCPGPAADCPQLRYFFTCGDPVCGVGGHREHPGVPPCTDQRVGAPCTMPGEQCDPGDDCNELLECTTHRAGPCPISRRRYKDDIRYLTDADRERLRDELLRLPLARYRYKGEQADAPAHLGFIIDDVGASPAVAGDGEHVDVYAYASMAVAAIQEEAREIARLRAEVARLQRQVREARRTGRSVPGGAAAR